MSLPKLLYLGLAFPPGYADVFPEAQPAGHLIETYLIDSIRPFFEIRSVGISWLNLSEAPRTGSAPGIPHELNLLECKPELLHRLRSLAKLKHQYRIWIAQGWRPDAVMVCNFSPVYNAFVRWLAKQPGHPRLVLYLADSVDLQQPLPRLKRLRHALKPLRYPDSAMARLYDACVAVSKDTQPVFSARNVPWLWLPNGCDPRRAITNGGNPPSGKVRFGYFGTLAPHGGVERLINAVRQIDSTCELHICGWGKKKDEIAALCKTDTRLKFLGVKAPDECVRFVRDCDVMVNPRPIVRGNENNFSSKVYEYALGGRSILTSRLSGVDEVLGPDAYYFDATQFDSSLSQSLQQLIATPKTVLHQKGAAIQERMLLNYAWEKQGRKLAAFLLTSRAQ